MPLSKNLKINHLPLRFLLLVVLIQISGGGWGILLPQPVLGDGETRDDDIMLDDEDEYTGSLNATQAELWFKTYVEVEIPNYLKCNIEWLSRNVSTYLLASQNRYQIDRSINPH